MKDFKVNQFTKMLVMAAVEGASDPCAEAADQVQLILMVALKGTKSEEAGWGRIVEDVCQGAMVALMLSRQDLAKGAIAILNASAQTAFDLFLDAVKFRESSLQGIADIQRFVGPEIISRIQREMNEHLPAAARIFPNFVRRAILSVDYSHLPEATRIIALRRGRFSVLLS